MKIKRNSTILFFPKYYGFGRLPKDTCSLRARIILGFIFFLLTPFTAIYSLIGKDYNLGGNWSDKFGDRVSYIFMNMFILMMYLLLVMFYRDNLNFRLFQHFSSWFDFTFGWLISLITIALVIAFILLIVFVVKTIQENIQDRKIRNNRNVASAKKPSIARELYKSWKNKYCKKIEYEN